MLDRSAVRMTLSGDRRVFSGIYRRNEARVRCIGNRILGCTGDIDDFIQEVFTTAFVKLDRYRGTGLFRAWLNRIAVTTAINLRNRTSSEKLLDPETIEVTVVDTLLLQPEPLLVSHQTIQWVRNAIAELPVRYKQIIDLVYGFHLRYREIAEITEIPVGTIKSYVFRAKAMMRRLLREYALS